MKLTVMQLEALTRISIFRKWQDPKQIGVGIDIPHGSPLQQSYRVWAKLASMGLLERLDNSEQVRGERRVYYSEFRITDAGRAALQSQEAK